LSAAAVGFALGALRRGEDYSFAHPEPTRAWCVLLGLFGVVASILILRLGRKPQSSEAAGMLWFALLGFAASFFLSGAASLFVIPAAIYAIGSLVALAWRPAQTMGAVLAALCALLVWAPTLHLTELALGFAYPFATAMLIALMCFAWIGLIVRAQGGMRWRTPAVILTVGALVCAIVAAIAPAATAARPHALNISYFVDASKGEARVLAGAASRRLPRELAHSGFKPERIFPGDRAATWATPADVQNAPTPSLEDMRVVQTSRERIVRARLHMNGAYRATMRIPRKALPRRAVIHGIESDFGAGADNYVGLVCQGRACNGAEIAIHLDARGTRADWFLIGQTFGAAAPAAEAIRARRPASATPFQFGDSVITLTRIRP
jgi:hypothetical protein